MINICESYVTEYEVIFNGSISQFLISNGKLCQACECQIVVNVDFYRNCLVAEKFVDLTLQA